MGILGGALFCGVPCNSTINIGDFLVPLNEKLMWVATCSFELVSPSHFYIFKQYLSLFGLL